MLMHFEPISENRSINTNTFGMEKEALREGGHDEEKYRESVKHERAHDAHSVPDFADPGSNMAVPGKTSRVSIWLW